MPIKYIRTANLIFVDHEYQCALVKAKNELLSHKEAQIELHKKKEFNSVIEINSYRHIIGIKDEIIKTRDSDLDRAALTIRKERRQKLLFGFVGVGGLLAAIIL